MIGAQHARRATRALRKLTETDPAFAALALWCVHRDGDIAEPARSDAARIVYGAAYEALALHEQIGLAAHHVLHVSFRHATRASGLAARLGGAFQAETFNLCADALVNEALVRAGYALPRPCPLLTEMLAEVLGEDLSPDAALMAWDVETLYLRLAHGQRRGAGGGDGAGKTAQTDAVSDKLKRYAARKQFVEDIDTAAAEAESPATRGEADTEWRQRVTRAFEAGRVAGRGIGMLGHRLADLPTPRTPWEHVLRAAVTKAVTHHPERSAHRPARRWLAAEEDARRRATQGPGFEPGFARRGAMPRIALCFDCSASVSDLVLAGFAAEVSGISRRTGAEVIVLTFDADVQSRHVIAPGALGAACAALPLARGGGTDFAPVLCAAAEEDPSIIVVLSDLDGPVGARPGRMPVLWAVPTGMEEMDPPPFGQVLTLSG